MEDAILCSEIVVQIKWDQICEGCQSRRKNRAKQLFAVLLSFKVDNFKFSYLADLDRFLKVLRLKSDAKFPLNSLHQ